MKKDRFAMAIEDKVRKHFKEENRRIEHAIGVELKSKGWDAGKMLKRIKLVKLLKSQRKIEIQYKKENGNPSQFHKVEVKKPNWLERLLFGKR